MANEKSHLNEMPEGEYLRLLAMHLNGAGCGMALIMQGLEPMLRREVCGEHCMSKFHSLSAVAGSLAAELATFAAELHERSKGRGQ